MSVLDEKSNVEAHYVWMRILVFGSFISFVAGIWFYSWQWFLTGAVLFFFLLLFNRSLNNCKMELMEKEAKKT